MSRKGENNIEMKTNQQISENFVLSEGGPFYNALIKIPFLKNQVRLAILGLCITWLPLVIISIIEGTLYTGVQMPFLQDVAMQARMLIAFPMMIIIRTIIDKKCWMWQNI